MPVCSAGWRSSWRPSYSTSGGMPPQATYLFKHALIQEAAYQSLLKSTRQQYHRRIAQVLEAQFPETAETQPELLAHRSPKAGDGASHTLLAAGRAASAVSASANLEAVRHLTKGLELLATTPGDRRRGRSRSWTCSWPWGRR